jgi:phosphotransferase system HPr (HPr) family protein
MVKTASRYNADVYVEKGGNRVSGKSIMGLLTLEVYKGDTLRLTAVGEDAVEVIDELVSLVEKDFLLDDNLSKDGRDVG